MTDDGVAREGKVSDPGEKAAPAISAWPVRGFALGPADGWTTPTQYTDSLRRANNMTRAAQLHPDGAIRIVEVPLPALDADDLRVEVTRAGVNFWEVLQRRGQVRITEPVVLGSEGVGVVIDCGSAVDRAVLGTRVAWSRVPGSYADQVQAARSAFTAVPDALTDDEAGGLLFQGATAHYLANEAWPLGDGDAAAVTAAGGGVGLLLVQLLVARGVAVYGLTSHSAKSDAVRRAGATEVFGYDEAAAGLREAIPGGLSAVFDAVGGRLPRELLPLLRPRGAMVLYGAASGTEADLGVSDLGAGSYFLTRTAGRDYSGTPEDGQARAAALLALAADGLLSVNVSSVFPLAEASAALDSLESRATSGKVLVSPGSGGQASPDPIGARRS